MLKIRLQKTGRKNSSEYRVVVAESSSRRDGRFVEVIGHYHPRKTEKAEVTLNQERLQYWIGVGAQPTEVIKGLVKKSKKLACIAA